MIEEHPKILMFDINTIQEMITRLSELIPPDNIINDQLNIYKPVKTWIKIDHIDNLMELGGIPIKASGISGLEFKSF
jgi:hypothetical protein